MDFFEAPVPDDDSFEDHTPPPWVEPPRDVVAALIPDRRVLARSHAVAVLLSHIDVYPTGCQIRVRVVAARPADMGEDDWWDLNDVLFDHRRRHRPRADGALPDEVPRFGVQFADGSKATTTARIHHPGREEPDGPVLVGHGGGGGGGGGHLAMNHPLWLWPLPPAEPFDLVLEWPALGIELTRVEIDGADIRDAAERVELLFEI